jgi:aspartate racemase
MIGIIGGLGPAAGLNLARLITELVDVKRDQDHLPWLLINQPGKVVDRTEYLMGRTDVNPGDEIGKQILTLEKAGCTITGIACNTAHAPPIFNRILEVLKKESSKIRIVHAIDEVAKYARKKLTLGEKIGILGTTGSYMIKLHEGPLDKSGFKVVDPGTKRQEELIHMAIHHTDWGIKCKPDPPAEQCLDRLQKAIDFYRSEGAIALLLGCSEITLVIDHLDTDGLIQIRPMTILAEALVGALLK